jgi:glycosyltransferase involved in cell wall biosynthesis
MDIALNLPLNSVSFGQVAFNLLRGLSNSSKKFILAPIGQIDSSSQSIDKEFAESIRYGIDNFYEMHNTKNSIFKLWHLNGGMESFSKKQTLLSFYELDSPTKAEINCVKNNYKVCFSSEYCVDLFKSYNCDNVFYLPLAFDKHHFYDTKKKYFEDRITFNLVGKLEKRKHHIKIIKAWLKKYGNNPDFSLQCAIYNPFIKEDKQKIILNEALENKKYFNISFLNFMKENIMYNDFLNSGDIVIGMSGGEGWGLPEFHSVALGKYGVILNATGYKSWADQENSVLVEPSSKIEVYDDIHFQRNLKFNQGNIFDFDENDFIDGCEKAISYFKKNKKNVSGLKLQEKFNTELLIKNLLKIME